MGHICGKVAAQNSLWRRRCNYGLRNLNELLMTAQATRLPCLSVCFLLDSFV